MAKQNGNTKNMTAKAFFTLAIPKLRSEGYKGCHLIYSGLQSLIREYYGLDKDGARKFVDDAVKEGVIAGHPVRGGYMVYLPEDRPQTSTGLNGKAKELLDSFRKAEKVNGR
jgi:hypothetical protein